MVRKLRILLIDTDSRLVEKLADHLRDNLHAIVFTAETVSAAAIEIDDHGPFDVLVSDYRIASHTALDLVQYLKRAQRQTPLILHTAHADIDEKPFKDESYLGLVSKPETTKLLHLLLERFPQAKKS